MRLTTFSDYSLRVLTYLAVRDDRLATVSEIAAAYGVSANHLVKVVHHLAQRGYIETSRGKGGGMRLARSPEAINIGEVLRGTEDTLGLVECFDADSSECRIQSACALTGMLKRALDAFFAVLDQHTLADLLARRSRLARILVLPQPSARRA